MDKKEIFDVKPFLGSKDFELSKTFYREIGFTENFSSDELAEFQLGDFRFYLQNYYQKKWCDNSMLHISVANAQLWYEHINSVIASGDFAAARISEPRHQDYGALVTFVWDPVGILLHFAQFETNK